MADNDFESAPKAVEAKKQDMLVLEPKYFGPFWKYIENDDITDVDFNGVDCGLPIRRIVVSKSRMRA